MNEKNNQSYATENQAPKARRNRKKINIERETKVINHYANISDEERFAIGVRIFELLGLFEKNEEQS